MIFLSHILPEVQAVCDRVIILHHGRLVYGDHPGGRIPRHWSGVCGSALLAIAFCTGFRTLPCVEEANGRVTGRIFTVVLEPGHDLATWPGTWSVLAGMELLELTAERSDLERVFFDLIGAEDAPYDPDPGRPGARGGW